MPQFVFSLMFVSFYDQKKEQSHIDRMSMDGTGRTHITEHDLNGPVKLHFDSHFHRLFFADAGTGVIEHINIDGKQRNRNLPKVALNLVRKPLLFRNTAQSLQIRQVLCCRSVDTRVTLSRICKIFPIIIV